MSESDTATVKVTEATFENDVLQAGKPVVVDFWAEWCGPCRMIEGPLEELAGEMSEKVAIAKVNVDDNQGLAMKYGVRSIPMLLLFKDGEVVATQMGAANKGRLQDWISSNV